MDTSLNVIYEKTLQMPPGTFPLVYNAILKSDSTFLIGCTTIDSIASFSNQNILLYLVSLMGDSLNSVHLTGTPSYLRKCFGIVEREESNFAFMSHFSPLGATGEFIITDNNLNVTDTVNMPNHLYDYYSPHLIEDSIFVLCTRKSFSTELYISKIKETGQIIKSVGFGRNNSLVVPSYQNSLAINSNSIYFSAIVDLTPMDPFFGVGSPSYIMIGKLDYDLNSEWTIFRGGDFYYHSYNINATSDGGCIVIGTACDTLNHNYNRHIFIFKLNSDGSTTWIRSIKIPEASENVFPNPGSDIINIQIEAVNDPMKELTIYNIQGKEILHKDVNACQMKLNIRHLETGTYIVKGTTRSGSSFQSKFLKN